MNNVVITGIGLATPLALGREKTWNNLLCGQSAVRPDLLFPEILSGRIENLFVPDQTRLLSMAFLSTAEALQDSSPDFTLTRHERIGCTVSVSKPFLTSSPYGQLQFSDASLPHTVGQQLARIFKLHGPVRNIAAACATGLGSVILGAELIRDGLCDMVVAGAVESSLHPLYVAGFQRMGVLASRRICPYDRLREGFAIAEGAGIIVLERKDIAMVRGAKVYGELAGWAMGMDPAGPVAFERSGENISRVVRGVLGKMGTDDIGYINTHGTGTRLNDVIETRAIKKAFGEKAKKLSLSSTKAATGHMLGASGAVELGFCCLALRDFVVPPTLFLTEPDPECDLDYTPGRFVHKRLDTALSLSFGFGGQIAVVGIRR